MPVHKHLARLEEVWFEQPIFFVTTCTKGRRRELANEAIHRICLETWQTGEQRHGWIIGRYVVMPDHVHFFCAPKRDVCKLDRFVGSWKEWTAKFAHRQMGLVLPLWQEEFFDHVLRSSENYDQKWEYVRSNPVRAGLVAAVEDWPYQGELNDLHFCSRGQ